MTTHRPIVVAFAGICCVDALDCVRPVIWTTYHSKLMQGTNPLGFSAYLSTPAIVQPAENTIEAHLAEMKKQAHQYLLNVATNRKGRYDLILELKEHYQEYGFKSPAAAVEAIIQRSKAWTN